MVEDGIQNIVVLCLSMLFIIRGNYDLLGRRSVMRSADLSTSFRYKEVAVIKLIHVGQPL